MLIRMADGDAHFLDYREKAPAAATGDMYLDAKGNVIEGCQHDRLQGDRSAGIGGGMVYAQKKYGKLSLARVMAPAIKLAREGFALDCEDAEDLATISSWRSFRNRAAFFSAMANLLQAGESFPASRSWRARWSASPRIRMISIMAIWRGNWRQPCKRAAG